MRRYGWSARQRESDKQCQEVTTLKSALASKEQAVLGEKLLEKGHGTIAWSVHNEQASKEQSDLGAHTITGSKAFIFRE